MSQSELCLLTDLYQLTMCNGYFCHGIADRQAVFHLNFRTLPFGGGYAIGCGLAQACEYLDALQFTDDDIDYLAGLTGADDKPLFDRPFLQFLRESDFACTIDAVPEGTIVFSHEPLVRVRGPLWQCQLIETALLTIINFQTLIATKASRIAQAAEGDDVLEFGLRRAQGINGGLTASRAAYVGGCTATSNVLAGKKFDIPVRGTHAHSWVMAFDNEMEAFQKYASAMPNNCVLLVDTFDTIEGVQKAIEVGKSLLKQNQRLLGIRLDSGDLCQLSIEARRLLDAAGMRDAKIVASNDLDEYEITHLKQSGARIDVWGVGTRLSTAYDQPALGGVYKLAAIQDEHGRWEPRIKLSQQSIKVSNPGILQVWRASNANQQFVGDVIVNEMSGETSALEIDSYSKRDVNSSDPCSLSGAWEPLLQNVYQDGKRSCDLPTACQARDRAISQLQRLDDSIRALEPSAKYLVTIEASLLELKQQLIEASKSVAGKKTR